MKHSSILKVMAIVIASIHLVGCSTTGKATDFNGLSSPDGQPVAHLSTTNYAVHLLMGKNPLWGDATLQKTMSDFTASVKAQNVSKVRIVQSSSRSLWYLFFPITAIVTPVITNVAGEAIQ